MKPQKTLDQLLEAIRKNVVESYRLLQTQNATDLSKLMSELAMQNFSISWYVAEYEFESKTLEAEHKRQVSVTFMQEREGGATEKNADAKARQKWFELYDKYLMVNKFYRLARSTHGDVENLLDIMRSRISLLKMEMANLKEK